MGGQWEAGDLVWALILGEGAVEGGEVCWAPSGWPLTMGPRAAARPPSLSPPGREAFRKYLSRRGIGPDAVEDLTVQGECPSILHLTQGLPGRSGLEEGVTRGQALAVRRSPDLPSFSTLSTMSLGEWILRFSSALLVRAFGDAGELTLLHGQEFRASLHLCPGD